MIEVPFSNVMKFGWEPKPAWGKKDDKVWFRCQCGSIQFLDGWDIAGDGTVSPSIDHSEDPNFCNFHDHVKLVNWGY